MKNTILLLLMVIFSYQSNAQEWCPGAPNYTVNMIAKDAELIFEGRSLSDSGIYIPQMSMIGTYHRVLVLKQFKGNFKSDTIVVIDAGGRARVKGEWQNGDVATCVKPRGEAVFFVSSTELKRYKMNVDDLYFIIYGGECGYKSICDKKDVEKEIYDPIETATGQGYIDIHPNTCKTQSSSKLNQK